ncbi:hypothetical protein M514_02038 [Trichuris suis]|uniref:Endonuclease/exonuclease/phosphatase domain-containing protein n=1 Tax=Trichuris suis TaxID=68888 RepID=A0A085N2A2_9BILA|nr:hypothetical protein M514_02038 [Trichuris suis]
MDSRIYEEIESDEKHAAKSQRIINVLLIVRQKLPQRMAMTLTSSTAAAVQTDQLRVQRMKQLNADLLDHSLLYVLESEDKLKLLLPFATGVDKTELVFMRERNAPAIDTLTRMVIKINHLKKPKRKQLRKKQSVLCNELNDCVESELTIKDVVVRDSVGNIVDSSSWSTEELFSQSKGYCMTIGERNYRIVSKVPTVTELKVECDLLAGLSAYPTFSISNGSRNDCQFFWYIKEIGEVENGGTTCARMQVDLERLFLHGWTLRSKSCVFVPKEEDVGREVCLVCFPNGPMGIGLPRAYLCGRPVGRGPASVLWKERHALCQKTPVPHDVIRLMSYNILADVYLDLKLPPDELYFKYCPVEYQRCGYRISLLMNEIPGYKADLICLQEVDMRLFDSFWAPFLNEFGLRGNFQCKVGDISEGLAIFFNQDKFSLLKCENVVLSELVASRASDFEYFDDCLRTNDEVQQLFMSRPQVLQVSVLSCSFNEDMIIIVGNTHLHSKSPDSHIRLLQAAACVKHLESVLASVQSSFPDKYVSVLFCGDLNSTPEMSVHRLLTTGVVHKEDSDWRNGDCRISISLSLDHCSFDVGEFPGFDGLEFVHVKVLMRLESDNMPTFGCLDYVYASGELQVRNFFPAPPPDVLFRHRGLPSVSGPSDHIPLLMDIEIVKNVCDDDCLVMCLFTLIHLLQDWWLPSYEEAVEAPNLDYHPGPKMKFAVLHTTDFKMYSGACRIWQYNVGSNLHHIDQMCGELDVNFNLMNSIVWEINYLQKRVDSVLTSSEVMDGSELRTLVRCLDSVAIPMDDSCVKASKAATIMKDCGQSVKKSLARLPLAKKTRSKGITKVLGRKSKRATNGGRRKRRKTRQSNNNNDDEDDDDPESDSESNSGAQSNRGSHGEAQGNTEVEESVDEPVYCICRQSVSQVDLWVSAFPELIYAGDLLDVDLQASFGKSVMLCARKPRIRLMSYNILADVYLDLKLPPDELYFKYCPVEYQRCGYRIALLMNEIPDDYDWRAEFCETFLENSEKVLNINQILWTDKAIFRLCGHVNRHKITYWSDANPQQTLEREVNAAPGLVVWAGTWSGGVLGPFFFDGNVTADSYLKMITDQVMLYANNMDLMFMHDGGHRLTARYMSPDLTPPDFFLYGFTRNQVHAKKRHSLLIPKKAIEEAFTEDWWLPSYEEAVEAPNLDYHPGPKMKVWASPLADIRRRGGRRLTPTWPGPKMKVWASPLADIRRRRGRREERTRISRPVTPVDKRNSQFSVLHTTDFKKYSGACRIWQYNVGSNLHHIEQMCGELDKNFTLMNSILSDISYLQNRVDSVIASSAVMDGRELHTLVRCLDSVAIPMDDSCVKASKAATIMKDCGQSVKKSLARLQREINKERAISETSISRAKFTGGKAGPLAKKTRSKGITKVLGRKSKRATNGGRRKRRKTRRSNSNTDDEDGDDAESDSESNSGAQSNRGSHGEAQGNTEVEESVDEPVYCICRQNVMLIVRRKLPQWMAMTVSSSTAAAVQTDKLRVRRMKRLNAELLDQSLLYVFETENKLKLLLPFSAGEEKSEFVFMRERKAPAADTVTRMVIKINHLKKPKRKQPRKKQTVSCNELNDCVESELTVKDVIVRDSVGNVVDSFSWSTEELFFQSKGYSMSIGGHVYRIVSEMPTVTKLKVECDLMAGLSAYPIFSISNGSRNDCQFYWYVKEMGETENSSTTCAMTQVELERLFLRGWTLRSKSCMFVPTEEDVGREVCLVCFPNGPMGIGLPRAYLCGRPVGRGPASVLWKERHALCQKTPVPHDVIRLMSYNILADVYLDLKLPPDELYFKYCPVEYQRCGYRIALLMNEIPGYKADLICLQEVDKRLFDNLWAPFLNEFGLCSNFQRKGGDVAEGLAIFFNRDKFSLLKCENVVLSELVASRASDFEYFDDCLRTNDEVQQLFMSRPQVLQVSVLSCSFNEDMIIIVGNTHLHSKSPDSHIRLLQAAACVKHLESVLASVQLSFPDKYVSVLFCGDLNSTPEMSVHRLLTTGVVHKEDSDWRKGEFPGFDGLEVTTPLKMICLSDSSMLTNITENFFGCLDYVYASRELQVRTFFPAPPPDVLFEHRGLPSVSGPSDHIPLLMDIEIVKNVCKN